jgi:hypothetical protein
MSLFHRVRSIAVIAGTWSLAFAPVGLLSGLYRLPGLPGGFADHAGTFVLGQVLVSMAYGALCGIVFALVLATRGRRLASEGRLTAGWWARWGALSAAALPLLSLAVRAFGVGTVPFLPAVLVLGASAVTGALCGAGTVALSRDPVSHRLPGSAADRQLYQGAG